MLVRDSIVHCLIGLSFFYPFHSTGNAYLATKPACCCVRTFHCVCGDACACVCVCVCVRVRVHTHIICSLLSGSSTSVLRFSTATTTIFLRVRRRRVFYRRGMHSSQVLFCRRGVSFKLLNGAHLSQARLYLQLYMSKWKPISLW